MKALIITTICVLCLQVNIFSQENHINQSDAILLNASYTGDFINVLSGGLRKGTVYLGIANFKCEFNTEIADLWSGGLFFINAASTHGGTPSESFIGDHQVASNIEAGNYAFIQELWFKQTLGSFNFTIGVQDVNVEFAGCCSGSLFMNSSFGIAPTITSSIPVPVFPLTSLGLTVVWEATDQLTLRTALFDGSPTTFEQNPHNLHWSFHNSEGIINLFEAEYQKENEFLWKLGFFHHDQLITSSESVEKVMYELNAGVYGVADALIFVGNGQQSSLNIFCQFGYSARYINENFWYAGLGLRYYGVFSNRNTDEFGVAVAHAGMRSLKDETTIEITYKRQMNNHIFLQPNLQYIINPAGTGNELRDCVVGSLRFGILL